MQDENQANAGEKSHPNSKSHFQSKPKRYQLHIKEDYDYTIEGDFTDITRIKDEEGFMRPAVHLKRVFWTIPHITHNGSTKKIFWKTADEAKIPFYKINMISQVNAEPLAQD